MELENLLGKKPCEMTDDELLEQLNRLRTSTVRDGRIVGQTRSARRRRKAKDQLLKTGKYSESQVEAVLDELEANYAKSEAEGKEVKNLKDGETFLPDL